MPLKQDGVHTYLVSARQPFWGVVTQRSSLLTTLKTAVKQTNTYQAIGIWLLSHSRDITAHDKGMVEGDMTDGGKLMPQF